MFIPIRWKLLILLLAIALVPLIAVTHLSIEATAQLGTTLGRHTRSTLTELTCQQLQQLVSDRAALIGREANLVSLALQLQARDVERCLATGSPPARKVYTAEDFAAGRTPPDMAPSPHHARLFEGGKYELIPVSESEPVFAFAPGVNRAEVEQDVLRLAMAAPAYSALQKKHGDVFFWHFTSLENGVHTTYPGHAGYPQTFDPRQRRWYIRSKASREEVWTLPYLDVTSRRAVLTSSRSVYRPDGSFAGVTGIDVTVAGLIEQARLPRYGSATAKLVALDPRDGWDLNKPREVDLAAYSPEQLDLMIVAESVENEVHWQSPAEPQWLQPDQRSEKAQLLRDLYEGKSDVRRIMYQGRSTFWAFSPVWERRAFLVVIVPESEAVAEAVQAQESVLSLTRSQLRMTTVALAIVSLVILIVGLAGSRTVTRPISLLVAAAQRVAGGDFETRVAIRTRDELGELGAAFNEMVPHLQDRMRIRQSLALAMEVQQNLLPGKAPAIQGLDVAGRSVYCDETGGDYYDFVDLSAVSPSELGVAVGDVTGHGLAAALLMTTARALLRSRAAQAPSLTDLMSGVNHLLCQDTPTGRFMTLCYLVVHAERRSIRWSSAGHDPVLLYRAEAGTFEELSDGDLPLGIDPGEQYREFRRDGLAAGDLLVIGTDGIWETRESSGEPFGKERLKQVIRNTASGSADRISRAITDAIDLFRGDGLQEDDVTLVVVKLV